MSVTWSYLINRHIFRLINFPHFQIPLPFGSFSQTRRNKTLEGSMFLEQERVKCVYLFVCTCVYVHRATLWLCTEHRGSSFFYVSLSHAPPKKWWIDPCPFTLTRIHSRNFSLVHLASPFFPHFWTKERPIFFNISWLSWAFPIWEVDEWASGMAFPSHKNPLSHTHTDRKKLTFSLCPGFSMKLKHNLCPSLHPRLFIYQWTSFSLPSSLDKSRWRSKKKMIIKIK